MPSVVAEDEVAVSGLTDAEASEIRARGLGYSVESDSGRGYLQILRQNVFTFLNMVLVVIGGILISMGLWRDAVVATGLVLINALVGVIQEVRAKRRLAKIALLARAHARLIRNGAEREADPDELVVGDLLVIGPGDQILVDGRVVGAGTFECDESLLTGESDSIPKRAGDPSIPAPSASPVPAATSPKRSGTIVWPTRLRPVRGPTAWH